MKIISVSGVQASRFLLAFILMQHVYSHKRQGVEISGKMFQQAVLDLICARAVPCTLHALFHAHPVFLLSITNDLRGKG